MHQTSCWTAGEKRWPYGGKSVHYGPIMFGGIPGQSDKLQYRQNGRRQLRYLIRDPRQIIKSSFTSKQIHLWCCSGHISEGTGSRGRHIKGSVAWPLVGKAIGPEVYANPPPAEKQVAVATAIVYRSVKAWAHCHVLCLLHN